MQYNLKYINILFLFLILLNNLINFFILNNSSILIFLLQIFFLTFLIIINFIGYNSYQKKISNYKNLLQGSNETFINFKKTKNSFFKEENDLEQLIKKALIKNNINIKKFNELKEMFDKFLPKKIYNEIGEKGLERISLGNFKIKKIFIMFIDIAGFTKISEQLSPERTLILLNIYFDGIGEIIMQNGGYIDKYLGDGMMVVFEENYGDNAIKTSIEIIEFIEKFKISEIGKKIIIGIGINYGEVIVGTIGTKKRMEATVLGDTINIASRLEGLTRNYEKNIIISQSCFENIKNKNIFSIYFLGNEKIRGKDKEVPIYYIEPHFII